MSRIEELEKRLAADPGSRMFVQLAEEYRKAGLLDQAIDCCEKGLKKHPQYPSARVALGRALLEAGSFDRARDEFETVLKQVPDNILAHKFLGETYNRLGRLDEALKKYKVASTLAPEDAELGDRIQEVQAELAGGPRPAPAPPAPPVAASPMERAIPPPAAAAEAPTSEVESTARMVDLPPIKLVEVDEPMVLETTRDYTPPPKAPSLAPPQAPPRVATPPSPVFSEIESAQLLEPTIAEPPRRPTPPPPPAPPRAAAPAPAPPPAVPTPVAEIETPTMAEIYASQGHFDQALAVYRRIVERHPQETQYRERIEELLMLARAAGEPVSQLPSGARRPIASSYEADERTIQVLEAWLGEIRKSRGA
jgi:tetratricopeptide (TPR) repeat protein